MKKIFVTIILAICTLAAIAQTQTLERLFAVEPGATLEYQYGGCVSISKNAASSQYINLSRYGGNKWSLGTVYNSNTFAIGLSTYPESSFTSPFFTIKPTGEVGIGTTTPLFSLTVGNYTGIGTLTDATGDLVDKTGLVFHNTLGNYPGGTIVGKQVGSYGVDLLFGTKASDGNAITERMRITNTGNVGIGTTTPGAMLDVAGTIRVSSNGTTAYRTQMISNWDYAHSMSLTGVNDTEILGVYSGSTALGMNGNVGIGVTDPQQKLWVQGGSIWMTGDGSKLAFSTDGSSDPTPNASIIATQNGISGESADLKFNTWNGSADTEIMRLRSNGNVGIGTTTPYGKLNVSKGFILSGWDGSAGDGVFDGYVIGYDGLNPVGFSNREFRIQQQLLSGSISTALLHNGYATVTSGANIQYTQGCYNRFSGQIFDQNGNIQFLVNTGAAGSGTNTNITPTTAMAIKYDGKVGIGINAPQYLLDVAGTIRAKEVIVTVNGFPDFVFEKTYNLPKLHDVGKFIQSNGHLPNIPSAKEVEKNGMSMADLQIKLLQKVEELTLYAIEQQKLVSEQQKRIEKLESALKGNK